ncbi:HDOD domain-containing protein [Shewanella avicenniae]|uniref:HDOD domain-containing protein n=1 Tax=Shewanella avicenniae TaxID=2814294 RepID=A0ABX7QTM8_9GAMM|nr:HDOD domain-containing protein [Shewanella avicenniae]QSX34345.1 HDOD domain-containing protein [Shewanella avicenniae]
MVASLVGGAKPSAINDIEQRFYKQLISGQQRGAVSNPLDAELEAIAHKIAVEREAAIKRLEKKQQAQQLVAQLTEQLTKLLQAELGNRLSQPQLFLKDSAVSDKQLLLLELLNSPRVDLNRIRPIVAEIGWLGRDITAIVNSPSFMARRQQHSDTQVNDLKVALAYIGLDNLRAYIPYYVCRYWLSQSPSLLWVSRKVWRYSQLQGIAARALAELHQQDPTLFYTIALMKQLGMSVMLSVSADVFEQLRHTWMRQALVERDSALHDALSVCEFPLDLVWPMIAEQSLALTWKLPESLGFADVKAVSILRELTEAKGVVALSDDAKIIAKSSCYAKCMLLDEGQQLSFNERQLMYRYYELSEQEAIRLSGQNFRKTEAV